MCGGVQHDGNGCPYEKALAMNGTKKDESIGRDFASQRTYFVSNRPLGQDYRNRDVLAVARAEDAERNYRMKDLTKAVVGATASIGLAYLLSQF